MIFFVLLLFLWSAFGFIHSCASFFWLVSPSSLTTDEQMDNPTSNREKVWRKHLRDMYQALHTIDTVWHTRAAQFLPYYRTLPREPGALEQTIVTGTSTAGNTEQNYLRWLSLVLPSPHTGNEVASENENEDRTSFDSYAGEIGGYGQAPVYVNFKVVTRAFHSGDVLSARALCHNPNIVATTSSDGHLYVFDKSSIAQTQAPNKPLRPMTRLPPTNTNDPRYQERLDEVKATAARAEEWDNQRGPGQHKLALSRRISKDEATTNGESMSQSASRQIAWTTHDNTGAVVAAVYCDSADVDPFKRCHLGLWMLDSVKKADVKGGDYYMPPTQSVTLSPALSKTHVGSNDIDITAIHCTLGAPTVFAGTSDGHVARADWRQPSSSVTLLPFSVSGVKKSSARVTHRVLSVEQSPLNDTWLCVGCSDGTVRVFDMRDGGSNSILATQTHRFASHGVCSYVEADVEIDSDCENTERESQRNKQKQKGELVPIAISDRTMPTSWCPFKSSIFASGGSDGNVILYDLSKPGGEEPLFVHTGHRSEVTDIGWCWHEGYAGYLVSSDAYAVQVWKPRNHYWL